MSIWGRVCIECVSNTLEAHTAADLPDVSNLNVWYKVQTFLDLSGIEKIKSELMDSYTSIEYLVMFLVRRTPDYMPLITAVKEMFLTEVNDIKLSVLYVENCRNIKDFSIEILIRRYNLAVKAISKTNAGLLLRI